MAQLLLGSVTMRTTSNGSTNPWGTSVDDAWKDLVVSSAPPPPPREALVETGPKNRAMPSDITAWQEHGAPRSVELPVEEPHFSAGDRRLWLIAGTLMGLAALVLGLLGFLTFGGLSPSSEPAVEPVPAVAAAPSSQPLGAPEPARASSAASVATKSPNNPRALKRAKHARHHKRALAAR